MIIAALLTAHTNPEASRIDENLPTVFMLPKDPAPV
jgi:hypothetical protein